MPCDGLVAYRAQLTPDVVGELLDSVTSLEALRAALSARLSVEATVRTLKAHYHGGGNGRSFTSAWIEGGGIQVVLGDGRLTVMGRENKFARDGSLVKETRDYIEGLAGQLAMLTARERTIAKLKERYLVQADARTATGDRVIRLTI